MTTSESMRFQWRAVALPTAITLLLLTAIIGSILHFATSKADQLALQRQNHLVALAIEQSIISVANDQEASTYWDDAVLRTRERPLDLEWIDNNLGVWFHTFFHHDETYLIDPANQPIYAMQNGARSQPPSLHRVANQVMPLVGPLRKKLVDGYIAPEGSSGQTIGASSIASISGRPAIVSIKPIVSETGNIVQRAGSEVLHISVRYLDGSFLERLSRLYGIDRPRFENQPAAWGSFPIRGSDGSILGYINWAPFQPGEQVKGMMIPVLFIALIVVGLLLSLLLSRVRRSRMELEASRTQAQHLAFHDSLTGLPNRSLFEDRLEHALARRERRVAVLLLDLDRFKNVNDTLGHQAGDALIREFGLRLSSLTRESDTIARLGGDEFAILIEEAELTHVRGLAARIIAEIGRPFELFGSHAYVGVSIGVALGTEAGMDRLELIRRADIALYRAKDEGRNTFRLFSADMDATVRLRGAIEEQLRDALATGRGLCVHYQPQIGSGGGIVGVEALVRWDHPSRGLIAPEQFVPIAEDTGLILSLGEWVLRQACLVSVRWPRLSVAVNLSPIQFRSHGFFNKLMGVVRATGAEPRSIQLEVTERVLLDDDDSVKQVLAKLRAAGFAIVLDDFGTGYSSLSYLRKFEVDKIKIDRSFVQHLGDASDSGAIVTAVLALGQAMGLAVAAEGVETEAQRVFLEIAGCKEMQGYYFSGAVPQEELALLLEGGLSSTAVA